MNTKNKIVAGMAALALISGGAYIAYAAGLFTPDDQPIGYVGQPAVSNWIVSPGPATMYSIDYNSSSWSGNLHSYPLGTNGAITEIDNWTGGAAAMISAQHYNDRLIVSRNGTTNIPFRWASLSSAQKSALDPGTVATSATTSPVLDYIRGDISNEYPATLAYRPRTSVLGDIIHSTPVYCPASDCTEATVFVGANDGMLHAINAATGSERFAYVPSMLIPKLSSLKALPFVHSYFVDGRLALRKFGAQTILAGALGGGGKGLFGLDVSNAAPADEAAAQAKILWEVTNTSTGYGSLGNVTGAPTLITLKDGTKALIVGNGYNNTGTGTAILYVINPLTGAIIQAFDTGSGVLGTPNGLSSPLVWDSAGDGVIDTAYAGDINGNLWKFDLSSVSTSAPTPTLLLTTSPAQAITSQPAAMLKNKLAPSEGTMVMFVTGRMFNAADAIDTDTTTHYAYGIWDGAPTANAVLLSQTLTEETHAGPTSATSDDVRVRRATNNVPNWASGAANHKGWKTALPISGERLVGDGAFVTGQSTPVFVFMTTNPTKNNETSSPVGTKPYGENWWMQLNPLTGGDNGGAILFDLNNDRQFTALDQVSVTSGSPATTTAYSPVGIHMGGARRSQLIKLRTGTLDVYQANYDRNDMPVTVVTEDSENRGVAGGHFDMEIFTFSNLAASNTYTDLVITLGSGQSKTMCLSRTNRDLVAAEYDQMSSRGVLAPADRTPPETSFCNTGNGFTSSEKYMTKIDTGSNCSGGKKMTITCNEYTHTNVTNTKDQGTYAIRKHVHEYDDTYDVTGVNMLNASNTAYNFSPAILPTTDTTIPFKILVFNQYHNPAARLLIGAKNESPAPVYVSVKDYKNQASTTSATTLLANLPTYTRNTLGYLTFNLPVDAFTSKDWWEDNNGVRSGLIPTDHWCVDGVNTDGSMMNTNKNFNTSTKLHRGLIGVNGERLNGALTIQIIRDATPASALELNQNLGDVKYGWRVKQSEFEKYVLAEYSTYWHHPNEICYGETGWVKNPATDPNSNSTPVTNPPGADPHDGNFVTGTGGGFTVGTVLTVSTAPLLDGGTKTVTVKTVTSADGTVRTTTTTSTTGSGQGIRTGGASTDGGVNPGGVVTSTDVDKRVNWREFQR